MSIFNLIAKPKRFIALIWSDAKKLIAKDMESAYHLHESKLVMEDNTVGNGIEDAFK